MNSCAAALEGVTVSRGSVRLLDEVSARVERGEMVGVVGPNGAGKTTLLKLMNGMIRPDSGRLTVLGVDATRCGAGGLARLRRRIGTVPQLSEASGMAPITTREVVEMGRCGRAGLLRGLSAEDRRISGNWMERLGIAQLSGRLYRELSGGEQRKAHLARALAQEPEMLLLDEPTSSLDPRWQTEISGIVEEIWREYGMTVVFVTHEPHLLPGPTSRILLVVGGRLKGCGTPGEVFNPERLTEAFGVRVDVLKEYGRTYLVAHDKGEGTEGDD